jgi:hypothetical protein
VIADSRFVAPALFDPDDGYLYSIGVFWYRVKLSTLTAERLTSTQMPAPYDDCRNFGVSAHYGMVAWLRGALRRISIAESAIPRAGNPAIK